MIFEAVTSLCHAIAHNEPVFAMAGYSVFRHADTEVDYCFIAEDTFCCLIINVKPEPKLIKDLLLIVLRSALLLQILLLAADLFASFIYFIFIKKQCRQTVSIYKFGFIHNLKSVCSQAYYVEI